ncbi:MAG: PIG-L family deacetylase [Chloroflexota bacterium]|nr:PIG-L family deacetylase [Chloroflexota bacterium]
MSTTVILSPHFDDGVLSCGGRIWAARQRGAAVRVLTLFGGMPRGEVPPFAQVQHAMWGSPPAPNQLRRAEDVAAHTRLGCFDVHHLDALDAVYRVAKDGRSLYGSEEGIFGDIQPEEAEYASELMEMVRPLLPANATVLAPLGAGHHVDHQLSHVVGRSLLEEGWSVGFYEELPYIEQPAALARALEGKATWHLATLPLSEEAMAAKVAAAAYYRTQIPVLFGDDLSMSRRLRAVASDAAGGKGYAERVWWSDT